MATDYYLGLAFPFKRDDTALPAPVKDDELVRQSILQILLTNKGERVMRPLFGCDLQKLVFENNNELLQEMARIEISTAITKYEPRAQVESILFATTDTTLIITVNFIVLSTAALNTVQVNLPLIGA